MKPFLIYVVWRADLKKSSSVFRYKTEWVRDEMYKKMASDPRVLYRRKENLP